MTKKRLRVFRVIRRIPYFSGADSLVPVGTIVRELNNSYVGFILFKYNKLKLLASLAYLEELP